MTSGGGAPLGRRPTWARVAPLAAAACVVAASGEARAQPAPQLDLETDGPVGVGDVAHVQLSATSGVTMPADPQLGATPGFVVLGRSSAPAETHIDINGAQSDRYTLTTTWTLRARRIGTFHLGPATVAVGGVRYRSAPAAITVLPAGHAPRRVPAAPPAMTSPFGFSPFDLWKNFAQGFDQEPPSEPPAVPIDPSLSLDRPRGASFFLHAKVDKTTAVVGEQVTFSVYQYLDLGDRPTDAEDPHDPSVADFAKHPLVRDDQAPPLVGYASIGGHTWQVSLLRRWALFPLRAGDLTIGPMRLDITRPGASAEARASETLVVRVAEPPAAGRPPGYAPGDVGRFSLSAQVSPRRVDQGGAVAVHVELSGTGNVPSELTTPARDGVEWLAPQVRDDLGPGAHDAYGGKRTFDYVVRLHRAGDVDLGEIALPFWDPDRRRYETARAELGSVRVEASASAASASSDAPAELLPGLPGPRDTLEGSRPEALHADDRAAFWLVWVGAWPAAFGAAVASRAAGRRAARLWRSRRLSPASDLRGRVAAADLACRDGDARAADAAIARALHAAAVARAGVNVRGALGGEVVDRLERAGVAREAASSVADLLRECEAARFAPEAADIAGARDRWRRAQAVIRSLERA